jgi:uncharacterized protein (TIGR03083 family)
VPTCPDWTAEDLARHVAVTYLHKVAAITTGAEPADWPPAALADEPAGALLARAREELLDAFAAHEPSDACWTWYDPDQTVAFWARRMAFESVVHRADAELAAGREITPIDPSLAEDGVDELLRIHSAWASQKYAEYRDEDLPTIAVVTGGRSWYVRPTTRGVEVGDTPGPGEESATKVSGSPSEVFFWLWRRVGDGTVSITGAESDAAHLRELMETATS